MLRPYPSPVQAPRPAAASAANPYIVAPMSALAPAPAPTPADRWGERLPRRLGLWSAVAVVIGSTIGSGIFRTPAAVARRVDDVPLFLLSWVLGGAVTLCGALTYAELAAMFPRSGGIYVFIREAFGPLPAFLFGWGELLIIRPGAYGAISITSSAYTLRVLGVDPAGTAVTVAGQAIRAEQLLAAAYVGIVAVVNYVGIHRAAILQNVSTALKVSAFGTLNGSMMTAPRIVFAMAEDRVFPKAIARVDPRTGAPTGAIVLAGCLGAVFVLVRKFTELADQFIIGIWPFYALAVAAVFVLRRRLPAAERRYRTWGYPVVPALFLLGALFVLGNYLVSEPLLFWLDVGVILLGIPVYVGWRRYAAPPTPDLVVTRR